VADLDIQIVSESVGIPSPENIRHWCELALGTEKAEASLAIRIVDENEIQTLNNQFRGKDKATNVLSFPADLPPELELPELGDIVICAGVVAREAEEQHKTLESHWAHMVIHGTLHLQGYDHIDDNDAEIMEQKEIDILTVLNFANPYNMPTA